jgi:hypothetical protein
LPCGTLAPWRGGASPRRNIPYVPAFFVTRHSLALGSPARAHPQPHSEPETLALRHAPGRTRPFRRSEPGLIGNLTQQIQRPLIWDVPNFLSVMGVKGTRNVLNVCTFQPSFHGSHAPAVFRFIRPMRLEAALFDGRGDSRAVSDAAQDEWHVQQP